MWFIVYPSTSLIYYCRMIVRKESMVKGRKKNKKGIKEKVKHGKKVRSTPVQELYFYCINWYSLVNVNHVNLSNWQ